MSRAARTRRGRVRNRRGPPARPTRGGRRSSRRRPTSRRCRDGREAAAHRGGGQPTGTARPVAPRSGNVRQAGGGRGTAGGAVTASGARSPGRPGGHGHVRVRSLATAAGPQLTKLTIVGDRPSVGEGGGGGSAIVHEPVARPAGPSGELPPGQRRVEGFPQFGTGLAGAALLCRPQSTVARAYGPWTARPMRDPNAVQVAHPLRMHELAPDFTVEDVWVLPAVGAAGDFPTLLDVFANLEFPSSTSLPTHVLWGISACWAVAATSAGSTTPLEPTQRCRYRIPRKSRSRTGYPMTCEARRCSSAYRFRGRTRPRSPSGSLSTCVTPRPMCASMPCRLRRSIATTTSSPPRYRTERCTP
jgi:hypothetical protein